MVRVLCRNFTEGSSSNILYCLLHRRELYIHIIHTHKIMNVLNDSKQPGRQTDKQTNKQTNRQIEIVGS